MHIETIPLGDASIRLETGRIARQADGAVVLRHRDTFILATVVVGPPGDGDFHPLTVDYRERSSAVGRIPGNYFRRELRPGEHEVLTSRLIDRSLRPLFASGTRARTQIDVTVYSADAGSDLPGLALTAAAAAVHVSGVPFAGPVAGTRLIRIGGRHEAFAADERAAAGDLDLLIAATRDGLVMIEGDARAVPEAGLLAAFEAGAGALTPVLDGLDRLRAAVAPTPTPDTTEGADGGDAPAMTALLEPLSDAIDAALSTADKQARSARVEAARRDARRLAADAGQDPEAAEAAFSRQYKRRARAAIRAGARMDGRGPRDIRPIDCETHLLPANHGSALFTRGETQALVSATLGSGREGQDVETLFGQSKSRFLLHYNFPGFSVGDARASRGPGRREIGHGHLARRALAGVMPGEQTWPYSVRLVSDITESNGSSSMATVCGGTLALLAAGVPVAAPVAGIAMGLVRDADGATVLSDILGDEDWLGDMDFKVAGTADGVTAIQLDNKLGDLPLSLLAEALEQARVGRRHILDAMAPAIEALPAQSAGRTPRHASFRIDQGRVGHVIGSGGRTLNQIQSRTGARVEVSRDGMVLLLGGSEAIRAARREIEAIALELRAGGLYRATVRNVRDYGVFVRIADHDGLVHQSAWGEGDHRQAREGDALMVRVVGADDKGRLVIERAPDASELDALNG